jgi:hypothetical protein
MQLAGEEVDTEVTMLASLGGDGDTDNLARAALQDEQVTNADKVDRDGDALPVGGATTGLDNADLLTDTLAVTRGTLSHDLFLVVMVERVEDAVGSTLNTAAEGVVVTFVVVVTHLGLGGGFTDSLLGYRNVDRGVRSTTLAGEVVGVGAVSFGRRLIATVVDVDVVGRMNTTTVVAFGDVELSLKSFVLSGALFFVTTNRFLVAIGEVSGINVRDARLM